MKKQMNPRYMTYSQAYEKCLDIASAHAERADKNRWHARFHEAYSIYQEMGALMLQIRPLKPKRKYHSVTAMVNHLSGRKFKRMWKERAK